MQKRLMIAISRLTVSFPVSWDHDDGQLKASLCRELDRFIHEID